jgi:hypothetical protein
MFTRCAALAAALALAAAAGCGGRDDSPASKPKPRDSRPAAPKPKTACRLIPAEDIRRIMLHSGARPPRGMRAIPD